MEVHKKQTLRYWSPNTLTGEAGTAAKPNHLTLTLLMESPADDTDRAS